MFKTRSPAAYTPPDDQIEEAYKTYCFLVKNPKTVEEIDAAGGWSRKTVEAFRTGILPPEVRVARIVAFLEEEASDFEYDIGIINGLKLAAAILTGTEKDVELIAAPRTKPAKPKKRGRRK